MERRLLKEKEIYRQMLRYWNKLEKNITSCLEEFEKFNSQLERCIKYGMESTNIVEQLEYLSNMMISLDRYRNVKSKFLTIGEKTIKIVLDNLLKFKGVGLQIGRLSDLVQQCIKLCTELGNKSNEFIIAFNKTKQNKQEGFKKCIGKVLYKFLELIYSELSDKTLQGKFQKYVMSSIQQKISENIWVRKKILQLLKSKGVYHTLTPQNQKLVTEYKFEKDNLEEDQNQQIEQGIQAELEDQDNKGYKNVNQKEKQFDNKLSNDEECKMKKHFTDEQSKVLNDSDQIDKAELEGGTEVFKEFINGSNDSKDQEGDKEEYDENNIEESLLGKVDNNFESFD